MSTSKDRGLDARAKAPDAVVACSELGLPHRRGVSAAPDTVTMCPRVLLPVVQRARDAPALLSDARRLAAAVSSRWVWARLILLRRRTRWPAARWTRRKRLRW